MNRLPSILVIATAVLIACQEPVVPKSSQAITAERRPPTYVAVDLGTLPGVVPVAEAKDVNEKRQVVGWSGCSVCLNSKTRAFLWENGVMTDLGTIGGDYSSAFFINDQSQITGSSSTAAGERHAFFWEAGTMTDLGTLGGPSSIPTALTPDGTVIGWSSTASGGTHPFRWRAGVLEDLGTLGGDYSAAVAINGRGQVVGGSLTATGEFHAFLWDAGVMTDLGTLGGTFSSATSISEPGAITGWSTDAGGVRHAFLWEHGIMRQLDEPPGFTTSIGTAVNNPGLVAGYVSGPSGQESHGVVWTDAASPVVLGDLYPPRPRTFVVAMNERGQVVGGSSRSPSVTPFHAVLWDDGQLQDLGAMGRPSSRPNAINQRGDVVGWTGAASPTPDTFHAVLWMREAPGQIP